MMGMILKDLYTLARYSRFLLVYLLLFGVIFMGQEGAAFGSMVVVLVATLSISTFSYDDQAGWDKYALSTPVSRKKVVLAKYLLSLLLVALGAVLGLVLTFAAALLRGGAVAMEALVTLGASALLGAVCISVVIPFIYKFGTEKSRLIMMLVYALPALGIAGLAHMLSQPQVAAIARWFEASAGALLVAVPLFCIAVICFSYILSVRIYQKKEIQ